MIDTIVCVLKSGGTVYNKEYVDCLMGSVKQYNVERICLTDHKETFDYCSTVQLRHSYPGWWSKLEIFDHPELKDRSVLYFDLDTVIKGPIDAILNHKHNFTMLRGFLKYAPASGVMAFKGDYSHITESFSMDVVDDYKTLDRLGDQAFIREHANTHIDLFQDLFPDHFSSVKLSSTEQIQKSSIVCFHGRPRPHQVNWNIYGHNQ